jgi:hypothetical protein
MAFPRDESFHAGAVTGSELERRRPGRAPASSSVELIRKDESGQRLIENGQAIDVSSGGMAVQASLPLAAASCLILRAPTVGIVALAQVRHCSWNRSAYRVGMRFLMKAELPCGETIAEPDYHEFLREAVAGEASSSDFGRAGHLHQVYRSLSFRYHPDNRDTGDAEIFLCVGEIYRIVSGPKENSRAEERAPAAGACRNAFHTPGGERGRRLSVLGLLYQRRMSDCRDANLSAHEIREITGSTSGELEFALWYLREKGLVAATDSAAYSITAHGVDMFEDAVTVAAI